MSSTEEETSSDEDLVPDTGDEIGDSAESLDEDDTEENEVEQLTSVPANDRSELDATRMYLNEIGASTLLIAEEEVDLTRRAHKGDEEARRKMIVCNLRLVVKIARRYLNRGMPLLDLIEVTQKQARLHAAYLAGDLGPRPAGPVADRVRSTVEEFTDTVIARMIPIGQMLRQSLVT